MAARSLSSGRALVLTALLASFFGVLVVSPVAVAQTPEEQQYGCGFGGCEPGTDTREEGKDRDKTAAPSGSGDGGSSGGGSDGSGAGSGGSSDSDARLGPDSSGVGAGFDSDDASAASFDKGSSNSPADGKVSEGLDGRSLGEVLAGGTDGVAKPAASTNAGARAAETVNDDGGNGLLWLLVALGAVTAVAAGGVAVRRRQAQQGFAG